MNAKAVCIALSALALAGAIPISLGAQPAPPAGPASPPAATEPAAAQPAPPAQPAGAAPGATAGPLPVEPPAPPPAWLPRHIAQLQIVEKVDATRRTLDIPVGGTAKLGTLAIAVKACLVRPPGRHRDAAAYLDITGKDPTSPVFEGWMLAAEPAVSLFQDPLYDVRVSGCS